MTASFRFHFDQFQKITTLEALDAEFIRRVRQQSTELHQTLLDYRAESESLNAIQVSGFLLQAAPLLQQFLAEIFAIEEQLEPLRKLTCQHGAVAHFGAIYVRMRVRRLKQPSVLDFNQLQQWLEQQLGQADDGRRETAVAQLGLAWLEDEQANADNIEKLTQWCALVQLDPYRAQIEDWISFKSPGLVDPARLVTLQQLADDDLGRLCAAPEDLVQRDGFSLTDKRMDLDQVMYQVEYCKYCHDHQGDSCSIGFAHKKNQPQLGLKNNSLGVTLTGCPLQQKISEMTLLKKQGQTLAALAVAMVDNPMIPATGHRICNDCMKACIYQKRDPVDMPQIESRVLTDVLELPWGVEIYDLLTRWNPLRHSQITMQPYTGRNVLVSGLGPAGFTMAHHLSMAGCAVVAIDGLKIEPLPQPWLQQPIKDYAQITESLDQRILTGFGGVAEYGITVRWDKNFLRLIYLVLARRNNIQIFGGTRLGGTLTLDDAWELGFDHVCIAHGAGLPRVIAMGESLARGMRQASDFLMALQLTGAAKADSLANLQIRLPAVVIGGGLTAIDTATELQAYYIVQVEKTLKRYEKLQSTQGHERIVAWLDQENRLILDEFLAHGRALRAERQQAAAEQRAPDLLALIHAWGGVTVAYRRGINKSPAYQRNHEEIIKALEQGIFYLEGVEPHQATLDQFGHIESLICARRKLEDGRWLTTNETVTLKARAVLVAAGTFPNTVYESEYPGSFSIERDHFLPHVGHQQGDQAVDVAAHCKSPEFGPFTSYNQNRRRVSFIGDSHPVFNGSVVKAIASAARSYPAIIEVMSWLPAATRTPSIDQFQRSMKYQLSVSIAAITEQHPMVTEIRVSAPLAARNFKPGQFFRLQMYETLSPLIEDTRLQIPLQTISGAGVDGDQIRLMLLKWGANAKLAARLQPGDPIVLMGPSGAANPISNDKTILVIAGSWGAAVMLDLGPAMRAAGNRVVYIAAYPNRDQIYCKQELEAAADQIIWAVAAGEVVEDIRPQDGSVQQSDMVKLLQAYDSGKLQLTETTPLKQVDEILVMGGTGLLGGMQQALRAELKHLFNDNVMIHGTVGSPMQCMMKGVCGQCLQWQINPETGERTRAVFSCAQQDQPLLQIDIPNLIARTSQNRLSEHLTNLWVEDILSRH